MSAPLITISLWQPWASAIAAGLKLYETRIWATELPVGSRLAIHAAKQNGREVRDFWFHRVSLRPDFLAAFARIGIETWEQMPLGAVVATATFTGCATTESLVESGKVRPEDGEFFWGNFATTDDQSGRPRYGWGLDQMRALAQPAPAKGHQGFFMWDPSTNETRSMGPLRRRAA